MISLTTFLYVVGSLPILSIGVDLPQAAIGVKQSFHDGEPVIEDTNDFIELVQYSDIFVDKSLLIKKILECEDKEILITSPPRWGKSVNLNMFKNFLQPELDEHGKRIEFSKNYKLFKHGEIVMNNNEVEKLQKPLLISNHQNLIDTYQGRYPVIYLSLRGFNGSTYDQLLGSFSDMIYEMMLQHEYVIGYLNELIRNEEIPHVERARAEFDFADFNNILNRSAFTDALIRCVDNLSQRLFEIHGKKVFVILDHYDDILIHLITQSIQSDHEYDVVSALTSFFYYCFKLNNYLEKGIIAGNFHMIDMFAEKMVTKKYSLFENNSINFFGFRQNEVNLLLKELSIPKKLQEEAPYWYGGYNAYPDRNAQLYCPRSIMQMIKNKKLDIYNVTTDRDSFIQNMIRRQSIRNILLSVIDGASESIKFTELHFNEPTLKTFKKLYNSSTEQTTHHMVTSTLTYLSSLGYFTAIFKSAQVAIIRPPNHEARIDLADKLMRYYQDEYNISTTTMDTVVENLLEFINSQEKKNDDFEKSMQHLVYHLPINYYQVEKHGDDTRTADQQCELLMRFLLHYLASRIALRSDYHIPFPCEGVKCDIILSTENYGVLIDVKFSVSAPNQLAKAINESRTTLERIPGLKSMKLIGINVQKDKKLHTDAIFEKLRE